MRQQTANPSSCAITKRQPFGCLFVILYCIGFEPERVSAKENDSGNCFPPKSRRACSERVVCDSRRRIPLPAPIKKRQVFCLFFVIRDSNPGGFRRKKTIQGIVFRRNREELCSEHSKPSSCVITKRQPYGCLFTFIHDFCSQQLFQFLYISRVRAAAASYIRYIFESRRNVFCELFSSVCSRGRAVCA